jgi:putative inorganic carbon (hco3(-)) transporter
MGAINGFSHQDLRQVIGGAAADSATPTHNAVRRKPLYGAFLALLFFMVVYYARPEDWIPGLSHIPLAKITAILAMLALVFSLRHIRGRMPQEIVLLFLLIIQLFISSLVSPVSRDGALQQTLDFAKILMVFLVITSAVSTLRRLRLLIFTQAISVSAIAALAIWKGRMFLGRLDGILRGNYADPNDMALAFLISLPLCLALLFLSRNRLGKAFWSISILVMLRAVFLTGSRGGFLALLVVTAVCLWEFGVRGRRGYLLLLAALVGVVFWHFYGGMLIGRFKGTFDVNQDTAAAFDSGRARQQLFWRSIEVTKEHPYFGVGPGNFDAVSGQWQTTHNSLTLMSSEGGVPALILYCLILWCAFRNLNETKRLVRGQAESKVLARALFASLAGYAVGSLFLSVAYQFSTYILVAYTTALVSISRKSAARSRKFDQAQHVDVEEQLSLDAPESEISFHPL